MQATYTTTSDFPSTHSLGTATSWASLPTPLQITFLVKTGESVLLLASISRVEHAFANINTNFNIIIDGSTEVAISNTGTAYKGAYDVLAFHGVAEGLSAGTHTAEVKYFTQSGQVWIPGSAAGDGSGYTSLTAQIVPSAQLSTSAYFLTSDSDARAWSESWDSLRDNPQDLSPVPYRPVTVSFDVVTSGEQVVLYADLSRVTHNSRDDRNIFFRIIVDKGTANTVVAYSNTGSNLNWNYDAVSFHGVAEGLSVGSHTAELEYKTQAGMGWIPRHESDGSGRGYVRLSSLALPGAKLTTTSKVPTSDSSGTSTTLAALPGGALSTTFTVDGDEAVVLTADIARVQHSTTNVNTEFHIVVDGTTTVAISNTGNARSWAYRALSFSGVATGLSAGSHTAEVQYKTISGTVALWKNSESNGAGYERITAQLCMPPSPPPTVQCTAPPAAPPPPLCDTPSLIEHSYYTNESLVVQGTPPQAAADCPAWCAAQTEIACEARAAFLFGETIGCGFDPCASHVIEPRNMYMCMYTCNTHRALKSVSLVCARGFADARHNAPSSQASTSLPFPSPACMQFPCSAHSTQ